MNLDNETLPTREQPTEGISGTIRASGKERPVLFKAPMVRAILGGRKTQMRQVVSPSNSSVLGYHVRAEDQRWSGLDFSSASVQHFSIWGEDFHLAVPWKHSEEKDYSEGVSYRVRLRWDIGDHLWVRETWRQRIVDHPEATTYQASVGGTGPWKRSRSMPRNRSRITLEIVAVRVDRLQEISDADAIAEGLETEVQERGSARVQVWRSGLPKLGQVWCHSPRSAFELSSDMFFAKGAWDRNEWVWVIEFRSMSVPQIPGSNHNANASSVSIP